MKRPRARLVGTGSYLPANAVSNDELATRVDTTDEWIRTRTGISQRHMAAAGELTSDLALEASRRALDAAGLEVSDLDLIIVATTTPDLVFPSTATILQHKLGANRKAIPAFDIQAVCTGFIYGLSIAESFITSGAHKKVLLVGAETLTRLLDWRDRTTCVLFGDGAGAAVLTADGDERHGVLGSVLHADGQYLDLLKVGGGVSSGPAADLPADFGGLGFIEMRGKEVFKRAVLTMGDLVDEMLGAHGLQRKDISWLVPHQANIRIIQSLAERLGVGLEQVVVTVDRHGNTSAASVPLALDTAVRDGRIRSGDLILMEAFGGGFTWGSALVRW
ncbi:MAG: ketoacyl-ACP synthase III [Magnetococcales bacterium]|nr:ketoacyl-ACP synthase III [Magnetococcales bacterium]